MTAMRTLLHAIALVLAFEGIVFALFPGLLAQCFAHLAQQRPATLRSMGVGALVGSVLLMLLLRFLF